MKQNLLAALVLSLALTASAEAFHNPVTLADQGSFTAGGTVVTAPGTLDNSKPLDPSGQTLHGDHAYVFYQKPVKAKKNVIVFLHGPVSPARPGKQRLMGGMVSKISSLKKGMPPTSWINPAAAELVSQRREEPYQRHPWSSFGMITSALASIRIIIPVSTSSGTKRHGKSFSAA